MRLLFAILILCICGLVGATIAVVRHIRNHGAEETPGRAATELPEMEGAGTAQVTPRGES